MTLYTWYMERAEWWAGKAHVVRYCGYPVSEIVKAQNACATYVALANQAAERYGA